MPGIMRARRRMERFYTHDLASDYNNRTERHFMHVYD